MSKTITFYLTDDQFGAVEKVAEAMRAKVHEIAAAALLQELNNFEYEGERVAELLDSLRIYSDGVEVPVIKL